MNITCNKCGKMHSVPDNVAENNKIYFFCSRCSHRIVVDTRTGLSEQTRFYSVTKFTDIFSGLFTFFNWSSILINSLFTIASLILFGIGAILFTKNSEFFMTHPSFTVFCFLAIFLIFIFLRNLNLYFMSKISAYRNSHFNQKILNWKEINFDFNEDWLTVLICSVLPVILLLIVLMPVGLMKQYGVLYAGLVFPVVFVLTMIAVPLLLGSRVWTAVIATGSYFVKDGLKELLRFLKREYVEIPFYMIVIALVSKFFIMIFSFIFSSMLFFSVGLPLAFLSTEVRAVFMAKPAEILSEIPDHMSLGLVILFVMIALLSVLFYSFCDNFVQAMYVKAVQIMRMNPEESFSRKTMLLIMVLFFLFILGGIAIATIFASNVRTMI